MYLKFKLYTRNILLLTVTVFSSAAEQRRNHFVKVIIYGKILLGTHFDTMTNDENDNIIMKLC